MARHVAVMVQGRSVLVGDHTYVVKDARRMPGVVTLHQESETPSKPTVFPGASVVPCGPPGRIMVPGLLPAP